MAGLATAIVAGVGLARCHGSSAPVLAAETEAAPVVVPDTRIRLPGRGTLWSIPGNGDMLALTLDDGVDSEVVRLYTQFAKDSGLRLTYFVNGRYSSWTDHLEMLRPLVDSGQIQLGNHTWSHPDLTKLPVGGMVDEIKRNDEFLKNTYGADATPFLRPPYGAHNSTVEAVAAGLGYTMMTLWSGDLSDSKLVGGDQILKMADHHFVAQNIVIGHLNHLPVTQVYGQLLDIIRARNLRTVTLNDVFVKP